MRKVKVFIRVVPLVLVGLMLHYVLPQHDIARVTSTEVIRTDFSSFNRLFYAQADSGNVENTTRDLRLINTVRKRSYLFGLIRGSEKTMVFRNEDTGWIWPPYFKFDSADLQAEATDAVSRIDAPIWVSVTHYGWRVRYLSIYPNATRIKIIEDPNARIIPWFNIGFFIFLLVAFFTLRAMWRQFRQRTVDPLVEKAGDQMDLVNAGVAEKRSRISRWLGTWRSKK